MTVTTTDKSVPPAVFPIIHIGLPKTATKTLQWRLFAEHSEVFYLGRFDGGPFGARFKHIGACRDARVFELMDAIAYSGFRSPDIEHCRTLLNNYLQENNSAGKVPVWSWESYCTDSFEHRRLRAENLRAVFGPARIVVSIRHPAGLLESAFMQQLKRDNVGARYRRGNAVFFEAIEEWVRRDAWCDVSDHLDYARTIQVYAEQFGIENVCVLVFEELKRDPDAFFTRLCEFMGIGLSEALALVANNIDNSRWTDEQFVRLEAIDKSRVKSFRFRFATLRTRKKMLDLNATGGPRVSGKPGGVRLSAELRQSVVERTADGNKWLQDTFGLELEQHGYL